MTVSDGPFSEFVKKAEARLTLKQKEAMAMIFVLEN